MKNKNIKLYIFILLFIICLSISGYYLFVPKVDDTYKDVVDVGEASVINDNTSSSIPEVYNNPLPTYRDNYKNNNIFGRLVISSLGIDTLITRTGNNKYYLNHDIRNQYSDLGNPFFDYRNKDLSKNQEINIYGHNTDNKRYIKDLPFSNLVKYLDRNTFNNSKDVLLYTDDGLLKYHVIAVKVINDSDSEHMNLYYNNTNEWDNHVYKLLNNSLYKDDVVINSTDQLLVLQACNYNPKDTYVLVICKRNR